MNMKTVTVSQATKTRLERAIAAQEAAVKACNRTCNGFFAGLAATIEVYAASHTRCAAANLAPERVIVRNALSALVWLAKASGIAEACSADARGYARNLTINATEVPDGITAVIDALGLFECCAHEAAVSLQCDIE